MDAPDYAGHHRRLRERFDRTGLCGLHGYEVLELLLTYTLQRRDTKPIAKQLLARFGSVSAVLNAPCEELAHIKGVGSRSCSLLRLVREIGVFTLREQLPGRSAVSNSSDVEHYLRAEFGHRGEEFIAVVYLDTQNAITGSDIIAEGTVNQCALYPRELFEQAFRRGAAALILAHNHPGGGLEPSEADWQITNRIREAGRLLDISLLDHLIVSRTAVRSLREHPRWQQIARSVHQKN